MVITVAVCRVQLRDRLDDLKHKSERAIIAVIESDVGKMVDVARNLTAVADRAAIALQLKDPHSALTETLLTAGMICKIESRGKGSSVCSHTRSDI